MICGTGASLADTRAVSARWPSVLWVVRHGESAGNIARNAAERSGAATIEIEGRDVDVPLSGLGERQSRAVGAWLKCQAPEVRPSVVLSSPYARARRTAELIMAEGGLGGDVDYAVDERLREKEFGSLNRLTKAGILARFPEEARRRADIGKFYYRPPGGESWCDVIFRVRGVLDALQLNYGGARVLIVAHQVVVLCFRYLLERLSEDSLLNIDRAGDVANCSITTFENVAHGQREQLVLRAYNYVAPLTDAGAPVTTAPDAIAKK